MIIGLMTGVMITGNYCFFNGLTIVLAALLCDDMSWSKVRQFCKISYKQPDPSYQYISNVKTTGMSIVVATVMIIGLAQDINRFVPGVPVMQQLAQLAKPLQGFHIINTYGLFATMTQTRNEIQLWGSEDSKNWNYKETKCF